MNCYAFSKIWILIILIIFVGGGILGWQYFGEPKEETEVPEEEALRDYNLKNIFVKGGNILIEDLITKEKRKITDIEKVYVLGPREDEFYGSQLKEAKLSESIELLKKEYIEYAKRTYGGMTDEELELNAETMSLQSIVGVIRNWPSNPFIEWSPDGQKIAFRKDSQELIDEFIRRDYFKGKEPVVGFPVLLNDLFVLDFLNKKEIKIASNLPYLPYDYANVPARMSWSQDSKKLAFVMPAEGPPERARLVVSNIELPEGERGKVVYSGEGEFYLNKFEWFPDNTNLLTVKSLKVRGLGEGEVLLIIDSEGKESSKTVLEFDEGKTLDFVLSPDGSRVIYSRREPLPENHESSEDYQFVVRLLDFKNNSSKEIFSLTSNSNSSITNLKWSPDGSLTSFLVLESQEVPGEGTTKLIIVDSEKETLKSFKAESIRDVNEYNEIESFFWSPDSKNVAIELTHQENKKLNKLWLVNLDGTKTLLSEGNIEKLKWVPKTLNFEGFPEAKEEKWESVVEEVKIPSEEEALARDDTRVRAHLRQVAMALEMYYNNHGEYPNVIGNTASIRWSELNDYLVSEGFFYQKIPSDPGEEQYDYYRKDPNTCILVAPLETENHLNLKNDIDNPSVTEKVFGIIDCGNPTNDKVYCNLLSKEK